MYFVNFTFNIQVWSVKEIKENDRICQRKYISFYSNLCNYENEN